MTYLASYTFLRLCPPGMVNFLQNQYFCPCPNAINLSYCPSHLLHQGVLVEVLEMDQDKVGLAYVQS